MKGIIDPSAIDWIRKEISRIRAFIHSQPQHEALIEVDTLLSVAESEAERHKTIDDSTTRDERFDEPRSGGDGFRT